MKLRHKTVLTIVVIFSCLSMFCIGFANWAIGQNSAYVTGTISAEEVSSYIELKPESVKGFTFGPNGFTSGNDGLYKATMSISYVVHPSNIYKYRLGESEESVTITVSLSLTDDPAPTQNILAAGEYFTATVDVKPDVGSALSYDPSKAKYDEVSGAYLVPLTLGINKDMTSDLTLTVTYTVDFTAASDAADEYKTYIYGPFGDALGGSSGESTLGFKFSASIEGGAA